MRHRHYRNLRGLAITLAIVLTGVALPWARAQGIAPVIPGLSIADIPIGLRIGEVVQRLGAPSEVRLAGTDGTLAYVFGRYGITTYTRGKTIIAVSTTNSLLGTARGVGLLAPEDAVRAAFGAPHGNAVVEGYPGLLYDGIAFGLDRHTVAVVMIFPTTSSATPPPTPSDPAAPPATPFVSPQAAPGDTPAPSPSPTPATSGNISSTPSVHAMEPLASGPVSPAPARAPAAAMPPASTGAPAAPEAPAPSAASLSFASGDTSASPVDRAARALAALMRSAGPSAEQGGAVPPDLSHLRPFTSDTKYLSLFGYLRYMIFRITTQWISWGHEALDRLGEVTRLTPWGA